MRWTNSIRFLFLLPAVLWVLVFTIVPLAYSLYAAFHNVTSETVVNRVEVPRLDKDGKPVLKPDGTPRKRIDSSKLAALGWQASTPLDSGIADTIAWYEAARRDGNLVRGG